MKRTFNRILVYLFALTVLFALFGVFARSDSAVLNSAPSAKAAYYFSYYFLLYGFCTTLFEAVYWLARLLRPSVGLANTPTKELPVPETNRLDTK